MSHGYIYIGCFVNRQELLEKVQPFADSRLHKIIENPHVTFAYRPDNVDETLFGKMVSIRVMGYANNGHNEGVKVELSSDDPAIREMAAKIKVPHITLSVSETGESVDTWALDFRETEPFEISGIFGGVTEDKKVVTEKT